MAKIRRISNVQAIKIGNYLTENEESFKDLTHRQVARFAESALCFTVTTAAVGNIVRGLDLKIGHRPKSNGNGKGDVEKKLAVVADALVSLLEVMGEEYPVELAQIAGHVGGEQST